MTEASPDGPGPAVPNPDPAPPPDTRASSRSRGREVRPTPDEAPDVDLLPDRTSDEIDHDRTGDDDAERRLWEDRPPHWDA
jgi:hypothetical protein